MTKSQWTMFKHLHKQIFLYHSVRQHLLSVIILMYVYKHLCIMTNCVQQVYAMHNNFWINKYKYYMRETLLVNTHVVQCIAYMAWMMIVTVSCIFSLSFVAFYWRKYRRRQVIILHYNLNTKNIRKYFFSTINKLFVRWCTRVCVSSSLYLQF